MNKDVIVTTVCLPVSLPVRSGAAFYPLYLEHTCKKHFRNGFFDIAVRTNWPTDFGFATQQVSYVFAKAVLI